MLSLPLPCSTNLGLRSIVPQAHEIKTKHHLYGSARSFPPIASASDAQKLGLDGNRVEIVVRMAGFGSHTVLNYEVRTFTRSPSLLSLAALSCIASLA